MENTNSQTNKKKINTRKLTATAMLTAVAVVLQYIELPAPFMPPFIKLDISDLPELIGAFAYGPVAGIIIALVKNLIHAIGGWSFGVGELSNFVLGAIFAGVAGFIYKKNKTKKGAFIGGVVGSVVMAVISIFTNLYIMYPFYANFMPGGMDGILAAYQEILHVDTMIEALLIFNLPFNILKGMLCVVISMLIYKPLSPFLHKK